MSSQPVVSRRIFVGGVATAVGAMGLNPLDLLGQQGTPPRQAEGPGRA